MMKNESFKHGLIGVVIGGVLVWLAITSVVNSNNSGMMGMMGFQDSAKNSIKPDSNAIDAHFIEQMIPHHEDAITMAKLALEKAQREELRVLAQSIIISQTKENEQMKAWYKDWFGRDIPTGNTIMRTHGMMGGGMHMGMMGDETDLIALENATDFDREFVEQMIPHHQMAVMMASMLRHSTNRPEMKKLAEDIIDAQTSEIDQMRGWLKAW